MIEGLKVIVSADELAGLCEARAQHHRNKVMAYDKEIVKFEGLEVAPSKLSRGDPADELKRARQEHAQSAEELMFIKDHVKMDETYLLDRDDLVKLGICSRGW